MRILPIALLLLISTANAFDYFEHKAIGDSAYSVATHEIDGRPNLARDIADFEKRAGYSPNSELSRLRVGVGIPSVKVQPSFGDLSATAGDHVETVEALAKYLADMRRAVEGEVPSQLLSTLLPATRRHMRNACTWLRRTRNIQPAGLTDDSCFDEARISRGKDDEPRPQTTGYKSSREELSEFERIPGYANLAKKNYSHFPTRSWREYERHHNAAIELADCHAKQSIQCSVPSIDGWSYFDLALIYEGFAQHFLQDSFASGHLGAPGGNCLFEKLSPFLCSPPRELVLATHDFLNDAGVTVLGISSHQDHEGKVTKNISKWIAYGDGSLFRPEADTHRKRLIDVATKSLRDILIVATPEGSDEGSRDKLFGSRSRVSNFFPVPEIEVDEFNKNGANIEYDLVLAFVVEAHSNRDDLSDFNFGLHEAGIISVPSQRSKDWRVPDFPWEGIKIGLSDISVKKDNSSGSIFSGSYTHGQSFSFDYFRPNASLASVVGFEYWNFPNAGTGFYLTAGKTLPSFIATNTVTVRTKFGYRASDTFTQFNPTNQRHVAAEWTPINLEYSYTGFKPVSIFFQKDLFTYDFGKQKFIPRSGPGDRGVFIGVRFDISGI
jgi:hypothetical protein